MSVIAYLRVSTEEQAASGAGLEAQRAALEAEAERRQWHEVDWVVDDGYSAKDLRRPGIERALSQLRAGRVHVLAVARLDRLSRSVLGLATLVEQAKRQGWKLVCLDPSFDLATPAGELMATMLAAFAQFERRLIGQRTAEALAARKAAGVHIGRRSTLAPATLARIFELRAEGLSWKAIADTLNAEGWPTGQGGGHWWPAVVRKIWLRATQAQVA